MIHAILVARGVNGSLRTCQTLSSWLHVWVTYLDVLDVFEADPLHAKLPVVLGATGQRHDGHERLDVRAQAGFRRRLQSRVNQSVPAKQKQWRRTIREIGGMHVSMRIAQRMAIYKCYDASSLYCL